MMKNFLLGIFCFGLVQQTLAQDDLAGKDEVSEAIDAILPSEITDKDDSKSDKVLNSFTQDVLERGNVLALTLDLALELLKARPEGQAIGKHLNDINKELKVFKPDEVRLLTQKMLAKPEGHLEPLISLALGLFATTMNLSKDKSAVSDIADSFVSAAQELQDE